MTIWDELIEQWIEPEEVETFNYDPAWLSKQQYRDWYAAASAGKPDPVTRNVERFRPDIPYFLDAKVNGLYEVAVFNCVMLKNGDRMLLDPMLIAPATIPPRPKPEDDNACTLAERLDS